MAIRDNDLYVFTHPETRGTVEERFAGSSPLMTNQQLNKRRRGR
jgi:hypothetical protein